MRSAASRGPHWRPIATTARSCPERDALMDLPGMAGWAGRVPGRVVWLAAMVEQVPDEVGAAAVMLVNDLAAVGSRLAAAGACGGRGEFAASS